MKKSVKSNMYRYTLERAWEKYASCLGGQKASVVCVVSRRALGEEASRALQSSFARLGYGLAPCTFLSLDNKPPLGENELFELVEALDPLVVVVTDRSSTDLLAQSFRQDIPTGRLCRVFGRDFAAFDSFESMLGDNAEKQQAWALLKSLPHVEP